MTAGSTLLAGLLGGLLAGAADSAIALAGRIPGLAGFRAAWLLFLGVSLTMVTGLLAVALALGLAKLGRAALPLKYRTAEPTGAAVAAVMAAPLVITDSFALFEGARAATIPGHQAISVALTAIGLAGAAFFGVRYVRLVRAAEDARRSDRKGNGAGAVVVLALLAFAVACYWANRTLLPRLYPWFHFSLSALFVTACVLAARLALALRLPVSGRPRVAGVSLALTVVALALLGVSLSRMMTSQSLRFAVHEKTLISSVLVRALPFVGSDRPRRAADARNPVAVAPLPDGPRRPEADVVLITVDALRADHVGAYGYPRNTTPHIDALARRGVRFERAYTQAPHTSFSVASMLTGKYYPTIARLSPGDAHDPIAGILRQYGWKTAAFYPPAVFFVDASKLRAYEENHFMFEYVKVEFLDAGKRLDQIAAFFESEKPKRAFLWLHLFEPHEPYDERREFSFGKSDMDRYDSEIAYTDAAVGRLLEYLQRHRPNAIVILTADHGEAFDEHASRYHGSTLYEEQVRVPLIVAIPGVTPHVVSNPVEVLDIAPTILGLLEIPIPPRIRGTDLGPWLAFPPAPEERLPPAFAELQDKRMVVWRNEKLICDLNWGYCAYHDLVADPQELKNLADERPERVAALRQHLDDWLDDHSRFEPHLLAGPSNPGGDSVPKAIERGRLGDLRAAKDLAAMLQSADALPPRQETRELVEGALAVADGELADWTAVAATRLGVPAAGDRVRALVRRADPRGQHRELRVHGALALTYVKDGAGIPVLGEALDGCDNIELCRLIIGRLAALADRAAVPALLRHLPGVLNRREVVAALGDIGDPVAVDQLLTRLASDEYVPVRAEAATALAKIGGDRALDALTRAAAREREPSVLAAVQAALAVLRKTEADAAAPPRDASAPPSTSGASADTGRSPRPGRSR